MTGARVAGFRCVVLHVKHSVESCVGMHRKGDNPSCRRCPIGAEHALGLTPERWPAERGGAPIERLEVVAFDRIPARRKRGMMAG